MRQGVTALACAVYWRKKWEDSNPDVGMGPSIESILDFVLSQLGWFLTPQERVVVLTIYNELEANNG